MSKDGHLLVFPPHVTQRITHFADGRRIESLVANSPAANAGLEPGDVIVRIDDEPIADLRAFSKFLKTLEPGQRVIAVVVRDGKKPVRDLDHELLVQETILRAAGELRG